MFAPLIWSFVVIASLFATGVLFAAWRSGIAALRGLRRELARYPAGRELRWTVTAPHLAPVPATVLRPVFGPGVTVRRCPGPCLDGLPVAA